jgi:hypothetical protein
LQACTDGHWWMHVSLMGYPTMDEDGLWDVVCDECETDDDCEEGDICVDGECQTEVVDAPPTFDAGPYVAAGVWPLLSTSSESPTLRRIAAYYGPSVMITHPALRSARTVPSTRWSVTVNGQPLRYQAMLQGAMPMLICR